MTSDNDDLAPTGMGESKNEISPTFEENTQSSKQEEKSAEEVKVEVPDMIENHQPNPEYNPTWEGAEEVNRNIFEEGAQKDIEKYSQHNQGISPTDQEEHTTNEGKGNLSKEDIEKEWSTQLGNSKERERS